MQKTNPNWLVTVFLVICVIAVSIMGAEKAGFRIERGLRQSDEVVPMRPAGDDVAPVPEPEPAPDPGPIPAPAPDVPAAAITVTDYRGLPVSDSVGLGQMLVISSEKSVRGPGNGSIAWMIEPDMQSFRTPGNEMFVVITPKDAAAISIIQMVAMGDKVSYQRRLIEVLGPKPQPKPEPGPGPTPPDPTPPPEPVVKERTVRLAVVTKGAPPADAITVINANAVWNAFREDGSDYKFYDVETNEVRGKKAVADAMKANIPPPALVVYDLQSDQLIDVISLPRKLDTIEPSGRIIPVEGSIQSVVKKYKGITP